MSDVRKLTPQEINLLLHLLRCGGDGRSPVTMLFGARARMTELWRLGLVEIWSRQSLGSRRPEGPFYTLTWHGRERATAIFLTRQSRAALATEPQPLLSRTQGVQPNATTQEELPYDHPKL